MKRQPINKDNYEEYFLLYVDNELTAAERTSVEEYIEKNPGLKTELEMFMSTRLDMEDVKMDGIEELYRYEDGAINAGNYEEFQVLMIDNELNDEEQKALESYHNDHPEAVANFEWLKKAKLPEEKIIFPDKSSLYRTARKPASIISIQWIRYAAAAAVIILAGLFWINNDSNETGPAQQAEVREAKVREAKVREAESQRGRESDDSNVIAQTNTDSGQRLASLAKVEGGRREAGGERREAVRERTPVNQLPLTTKDPMAIVEQQQIAAAEKNETRISAEDLQLNKTSESTTNATPYVQPAVAMNVKTNYAAEALSGMHDSDDEEIVTEDEGKQRRGLRGIVRKANRIYNKVTNPDLDKPLVKVANLEIGLQR